MIGCGFGGSITGCRQELPAAGRPDTTAGPWSSGGLSWIKERIAVEESSIRSRLQPGGSRHEPTPDPSGALTFDPNNRLWGWGR